MFVASWARRSAGLCFLALFATRCVGEPVDEAPLKEFTALGGASEASQTHAGFVRVPGELKLPLGLVKGELYVKVELETLVGDTQEFGYRVSLLLQRTLEERLAQRRGLGVVEVIVAEPRDKDPDAPVPNSPRSPRASDADGAASSRPTAFATSSTATKPMPNAASLDFAEADVPEATLRLVPKMPRTVLHLQVMEWGSAADTAPTRCAP